jgi:hypothetical protein
MAGDRKSRLLRIPPELDKALERAAAKDMRPVSVLIERILRQAMIRSGDLRDPAERPDGGSED